MCLPVLMPGGHKRRQMKRSHFIQRIFFLGFPWKRAISSTERGHFIAQYCKACNDYKIHAVCFFLNSPCWRTPHPSIQIFDLGKWHYINICLVGGWTSPLWTIWVKVSWDDDTLNGNKNMFPTTTNNSLTCLFACYLPKTDCTLRYQQRNMAISTF